MPKASKSDVQRRARAVCIRCHRRKVRCDLESQSVGVCSHCQHEGLECQPHIGPRKQQSLRYSLTSPQIEAVSQAQTVSASPHPSTPSPFIVLDHRSLHCSGTENDSRTAQQNYIAGSELILELSQATRLPSLAISQALSDFYFRELFPLVPVMDQGQFDSDDSVLLQQSLCFAGSIMRQSVEPPEWSPSAIYGRIKTLLFLHHEPSPINTLTALSVLSTWLPHAPEAIVLDNPWQWAGMAIRLALQLQLHEDKTYHQFKYPGRVRRIWWYLFNNDTLQMACSGRPGMFPLKESRVPLPEAADFDNPNTDALVFCSLTTLCTNLRHILELGRLDNTPQGEIHSTLNQLGLWRERLPPTLQLFGADRKGRQAYSRPVVELHIFYLVIIILTCFLGRRENSLLFKHASMAASSCIARLYEEILFHEDVPCLLPIHSWANWVASIPRTFGDSGLPNMDQPNDSKITQQVLRKMSEKHTSADLVLNRINALRRDGPDVFTAHGGPSGSLPLPIPDDKRQRILSLFHFAESFSPMLDLLRSTENNGIYQPSESISLLPDGNWGDWPVDWSLFLFDAPMSF